ncbi:hypothetical protein OLV19_08795 [Campylobacter jejuni]|nr:hypothetical protein [Campylobacter jejuni]
MQNPTSLIKNASLFKKITNKDYQEQHYKKYDEIYKTKNGEPIVE